MEEIWRVDHSIHRLKSLDDFPFEKDSACLQQQREENLVNAEIADAIQKYNCHPQVRMHACPLLCHFGLNQSRQFDRTDDDRQQKLFIFRPDTLDTLRKLTGMLFLLSLNGSRNECDQIILRATTSDCVS